MNRRTAITGLGALALASPALGAQQCSPYGVCSYYLSQNNFPIFSQEQPVWCWAAVAQSIFQYYGHPMLQADIVASVLNGPIVRTATPDEIMRMLNNNYTDSNGVAFSVSTPIYRDNYGLIPGNIAAQFNINNSMTNSDVFAELAQDRPLFYSDGPHALVLAGVAANGPAPVGAMAFDPEPANGIYAQGSPAIGLRALRPNEMFGYFTAQVVVT